MTDTYSLEILDGVTVPDSVDTGTSVAVGYGTCPDCSKTLKLKADGGMRSHKCDPTGEAATVIPGRAKAPTRSRRSRTQAPDKVRRLAVAVLASGVEWTSDTLVSKATDIPVAALPDELDLPDPDAMIGPFINLAWPQIPKGAQKALIELSEHEDLIAACFSWWQWGQTVKAFTEAHKPKREDKGNGIEVSGASTGAVTYVYSGVDPTTVPADRGTLYGGFSG